jgi:hypothetical protein
MMDEIAEGIKNISGKITIFESEFQRVRKELDKKASKLEVKEMENYMSLMTPITTKFAAKGDLEDEKPSKKL